MCVIQFVHLLCFLSVFHFSFSILVFRRLYLGFDLKCSTFIKFDAAGEYDFIG